MDKEEIKGLILTTYGRVYPHWNDVIIRDNAIVPYSTGWMAVVRRTKEGGSTAEELCYVYPDKTVRVFDTTTELANFLSMHAQIPLLERITAKPVVAAGVFVVLLIGLLLAAFTIESEGSQVMASLTGLAGVAGGYFFGSSGKAS
ncbi:hypothetical protein ACFOYU_11360 [Microvirga sp. GCM10011540]|uniref:hypothetical protein n=1 Tax=Microvirga sp. GCM10011540 TaxID=3317338 RepID=UPI0036241CB6